MKILPVLKKVAGLTEACSLTQIFKAEAFLDDYLELMEHGSF